MPRGYMEGPAAEEAERRLEELERGGERRAPGERLAVMGATDDNPERPLPRLARRGRSRRAVRVGRGLGDHGRAGARGLSEARWAEVDRYLVDRLVQSDPARGRRSGGRSLAAAGQAPAPARARRSGRAGSSRSGTLAGYSTIWLARALPPGGSLVTLELDEAAACAGAHEPRRGRPRRRGRAESRPGARDAADARRPVRPDLPRRRQGGERRVPAARARALASGHADRGRQRRPRRRRRSTPRATTRASRASAASSTCSRRSRA